MTREEARKKAEVMMAYAEGKDIEAYKRGNSVWFELDEEPSFNWKEFNYRIKKELKYRPFENKEECWAEMQNHPPFGWMKYKSDGNLNCVNYISDGINFINYYEKLTFADGTPFGIKEE